MALSPWPHPSQQNPVDQGGKVERAGGEHMAVTPPQDSPAQWGLLGPCEVLSESHVGKQNMGPSLR